MSKKNDKIIDWLVFIDSRKMSIYKAKICKKWQLTLEDFSTILWEFPFTNEKYLQIDNCQLTAVDLSTIFRESI